MTLIVGVATGFGFLFPRRRHRLTSLVENRRFGLLLSGSVATAKPALRRLPHLHPGKRRVLLQSISEQAATAPGWSSRKPSFYPEWVDKVEGHA